LAFYEERKVKPRRTDNPTRLSLVLLSRWFNWRDVLTVVKPRTFITWHRKGCIWGCRMPVEMIIDQWNPGRRPDRTETFCYGPRACRLYQAGPARTVPGRRGMIYTEEDWVDDEATSHRGPEE
jgi:hypothetical protein